MNYEQLYDAWEAAQAEIDVLRDVAAEMRDYAEVFANTPAGDKMNDWADRLDGGEK